MDVADSARRHGITDADILHAVRQQFRALRLAEDRTLIIGADQKGRLLEVVILDATEDLPPCAIHAMQLRAKFYDYL